MRQGGEERRKGKSQKHSRREKVKTRIMNMRKDSYISDFVSVRH